MWLMKTLIEKSRWLYSIIQNILLYIETNTAWWKQSDSVTGTLYTTYKTMVSFIDNQCNGRFGDNTRQIQQNILNIKAIKS